MLRIILKFQNKKRGYEFFELPDGQRRYFTDLVSHIDELEPSDTESSTSEFSWRNFALYASYLIKMYKIAKKQTPPFEFLADIFCKMMHNTYIIDSEDMTTVGEGLYLGASVIPHSCAPNSSFFTKGKVILIRFFLHSMEKMSTFLPYRVKKAPFYTQNEHF